MKDNFDRLFHPRAFSTKWAELSINQSAFKHVGYKEIELEEIDEAGNTAFHLAAEKDFLAIFDIQEFLSGGAYGNSNPKNKEGRTPFHIAAEKGYWTFCQLVLNVTTDDNPADNVGMTPLHLAAKAGHLPICNVRNSNCIIIRSNYYSYMLIGFCMKILSISLKCTSILPLLGSFGHSYLQQSKK